MKAERSPLPAALLIPLVGLAAWVLPGAGHVLAGYPKRGRIIFLTIALTFWGGVAIGGVRHTVDAQRQRLWFMAQICTGSHGIAAYYWGNRARSGMNDADLSTSEWKSVGVAWVYTGVAGLLNLLAISDALTRADPEWRKRTKPNAEAART
jgi:uncharacterized protein DUF6677